MARSAEQGEAIGMVRGWAIVAIALAASPSFAGQLDHYGGGGRSQSPDGRWSVWSHAPNADESPYAEAWLSGPLLRRRELLRYERLVDVTWLPTTQQVILMSSTAHFTAVALFDLAGRDRHPPISWQRAIERRMAVTRPMLATVENRSVVLGASRSQLCVLGFESGLPRGRSEGSFVERRKSFRLDTRRGLAVPAGGCPGATRE